MTWSNRQKEIDDNEEDNNDSDEENERN